MVRRPAFGSDRYHSCVAPPPARRHLAALGSRRQLATGAELAGRWRGAGGAVRFAIVPSRSPRRPHCDLEKTAGLARPETGHGGGMPASLRPPERATRGLGPKRRSFSGAGISDRVGGSGRLGRPCSLHALGDRALARKLRGAAERIRLGRSLDPSRASAPLPKPTSGLGPSVVGLLDPLQGVAPRAAPYRGLPKSLLS